MGFLERRREELQRLWTLHSVLLAFYREIENLEQELNATPCAFSAAQHFDHAFRSLMNKHRFSPFDSQRGLAVAMSPETVRVETVFGFELVLSARDDWRYYADGYNSLEASETILLLRAADQADCFLDIGANVGYYSLLVAASIDQEIPCLAFEPVSDVYKRLVEGIEANGFQESVSAFKSAVGSADGEATISINRYGSGGNAIITGSALIDERMSSGTSETARTVTLDTFLRQNDLHPSNALVKIDVEGFEMQVLDGATDFFSSSQAPVLLIETFRDAHSGLPQNDVQVLRRLTQWGYEIMSVRQFKPFHPLLYPAFQAGMLRRSRNGNYMAFHRRHKDLREQCRQPDSGAILLSRRRIEDISDFQQRSVVSAQRYVKRLESLRADLSFKDFGTVPRWEETKKKLWATYERRYANEESHQGLAIQLRRFARPMRFIIRNPIITWFKGITS